MSKYTDIFDLEPGDLLPYALELFRFQYSHNALYRRYTDTLGIDPRAVASLETLPYLPLSFFKTQSVRTTEFIPEAVFDSSGTTGMISSRHEIRSLDLYRQSFLAAFQRVYGPIRDWCVIGLLPSYLERPNSSLVVMVGELIAQSGHPDSGLYLYDHEALYRLLSSLEARGQRTLLIGVTFALLDFAGQYQVSLRHTVVMETGGMKGRRREMTRAELHAFLAQRLGVDEIHAEYGMTELLSQAYSPGNGVFTSPPWMKVLVRTEDDPLEVKGVGAGVLNVIDLANRWSCAFLATEDVGCVYPDGRFEVNGRVDNSDVRGCSLLVSVDAPLA